MKKTHNLYHNEEAVSEVIGFIYIFGIVILSMSMIYVLGFPMLQKSMDDTVFESTEQNFIVLQSYMKMVGFDQVPVQSLKIRLQGASISVSQKSNLTIDYDGETPYHEIYDTGEIEFNKNDNYLTYENGGVWKRYPDGSLMVSKPRIYTGKINETNITTIGVVLANGTSFQSGNGISILKMEHKDSIINKSSKPVNLTLSLNSTYYASDWVEFLKSIDFDIINQTSSSLTAMRNNTMVVVGKHQVNVEIT
jgi:FlaG/FlaF family flagellin (archaellin)